MSNELKKTNELNELNKLNNQILLGAVFLRNSIWRFDALAKSM